MNEWFVVGCGPSMKGFPWGVLKGLPTIAVNGTILDVPEPVVFLTACSAFATRAFRSGFWSTKAKKVLVMGKDHKNYDKVEPFVIQFDEVLAPSRYDGVIGFTPDKFATGKNSGFCAMQYAVLSGAKKIHLVGMDLNGPGHHYDKGGSSKNVIDVFYHHFVTGIRILQKHGIEVVTRTKSRLNGLVPYEAL